MSVYLDNFKDESIFELIEEIDNQGIKSNIDKSGKLNNIGKQNLKFSVEKYQNSFFAEKDFATNPSLIEEAPKDNKIAVINEQIKGVQNDMKNNVKNMVVNIQDINEMENKSSVIKDASFQFRKDSLALEKKMKKYLLNWMTILMVAIVSVGFVSCGDDDDDEKGGTVSLVGTWSLNFGTNDYCLLTFYQNGTVKYQEYDDGEWEEEDTYNYTYSNGILRLTYSNGRERETIEVISLSETKLVLKDWPDVGVNTFVKQ